MVYKNGQDGITPRHIEAIAYDGKKNIFTPVKFPREEHIFYLDLPARRDGGAKRYFQVSSRVATSYSTIR